MATRSRRFYHEHGPFYEVYAVVAGPLSLLSKGRAPELVIFLFMLLTFNLQLDIGHQNGSAARPTTSSSVSCEI
jgi:hypothetical protein